MSIGTVFVNNRTQAVRLPLDVRLPEGVHKVEIRVKGQERIIAPLGQTWDSFFLDGPQVSDDFLKGASMENMRTHTQGQSKVKIQTVRLTPSWRNAGIA